MIGPPPSSRQVPLDAGLHAVDFSQRYAVDIDLAVSERMMGLGFDPDRIGMPAPVIRHAAFHPGDKSGGCVARDGRIAIDSGLFNPDHLTSGYSEEAARLYEGSRVRDRLDAIIAHEYEEHRNRMSHVEALRHAPETALPISDRARRIAAAMDSGWKGM